MPGFAKHQVNQGAIQMKRCLRSRVRSFAWVLLASAAPCLASRDALGVDLLSLDPATVEPDLAPPTQVIAGAPGTPITWADPGGLTVVIGEFAYSPNATPITNGSNYPIMTAFAGDIVFLADPNGGTDPSNWAAVLRFLNPADPTGSLGLAATDDEAFLARDMGPNGFAGFSLFPNAVAVNGGADAPVLDYLGSFVEFGPDGGIPPGQTVQFIDGVSGSSIPEPGTVALLGLAIMALAIGAYRRRVNRLPA